MALPKLEEIADAIKASRAEFGRLFLQAQIEVCANPADRVLFEAVGNSGVDREAFAQALAWANVKGWLEPLLHAIVDESLEDGRLTKALLEAAPQSAELQAITNAV